MNHPKKSAISRREFARRAALASAASLVPASSLPLAASWPSQDQPQLSPEGQAESEARYQAILAAYPGRFSDDQKKELHRLSLAAQPSLDRLRAYPITNSDPPALYLKPLVEREKKPEAKPSNDAKPVAPRKP